MYYLAQHTKLQYGRDMKQKRSVAHLTIGVCTVEVVTGVGGAVGVVGVLSFCVPTTGVAPQEATCWRRLVFSADRIEIRSWSNPIIVCTSGDRNSIPGLTAAWLENGIMSARNPTKIAFFIYTK